MGTNMVHPVSDIMLLDQSDHDQMKRLPHGEREKQYKKMPTFRHDGYLVSDAPNKCLFSSNICTNALKCLF